MNWYDLPTGAATLISSEFITAMIWTIGALFIFMIVRTKKYGMDTKLKRRMFVGIFGAAVVFVAMFAGLAIGLSGTKPNNTEGGHGWGNPAVATGMAFEQIKHVFSQKNILFLGILYAVFQFVGGGIAGVLFIGMIAVFNKFSVEADRINLKEAFTWHKKSPIVTCGIAMIAVFILTFSFSGGNNLSAWPTGFPSSDVARVSAVFASGFAASLILGIFGSFALLALNPAVWLGAFMVKLWTNKKISFSELGRELTIPGASMFAGIATGALIYGLINLNQ